MITETKYVGAVVSPRSSSQVRVMPSSRGALRHPRRTQRPHPGRRAGARGRSSNPRGRARPTRASIGPEAEAGLALRIGVAERDHNGPGTRRGRPACRASSPAPGRGTKRSFAPGPPLRRPAGRLRRRGPRHRRRRVADPDEPEAVALAVTIERRPGDRQDARRLDDTEAPLDLFEGRGVRGLGGHVRAVGGGERPLEGAGRQPSTPRGQS